MPKGELNYFGRIVDFDNSTIYGFRLATNFARVIGLEHTIAFSHNFLGAQDIRTRIFIRDPGFIYNTNLVVNAPVGRFVPYATAGIGLIKHFDVSRDSTGFAVNYGGGLKFMKLAGPLGLRFDVRRYTAIGLFSGNQNILEVSGGLLFTWGE